MSSLPVLDFKILEDDFSVIESKLQSLDPLYEKLFQILVSFNPISDYSQITTIATISTKIDKIMKWQGVLQHHDLYVTKVISSLESHKSFLDMEIDVITTEKQCDLKLVNKYKPKDLKIIINNECLKFKRKKVLIESYLNNWNHLNSLFTKKAKDLQTTIHSLKTLINTIQIDGSVGHYLNNSNSNFNKPDVEGVHNSIKKIESDYIVYDTVDQLEDKDDNKYSNAEKEESCLDLEDFLADSGEDSNDSLIDSKEKFKVDGDSQNSSSSLDEFDNDSDNGKGEAFNLLDQILDRD